MLGMPHLVQMQKKYETKGLQIIGISLDDDKEKLKAAVKSTPMKWPTFCDYKKWKAELFVKGGWNSIPRKFLLDTEGKVVADLDSMRDAASMEKAIEEALKKTPPTKKGNRGEAKAKKELDAAGKLLEKKEYAKAIAAYEKIAKAQKGTPAGDEAAKKVKSLKADKDIARAATEAEAAKKAPGLMKMAAQLAGSGKSDKAREYYQKIIDKYPGTEHAERAKAELDKLTG